MGNYVEAKLQTKDTVQMQFCVCQAKARLGQCDVLSIQEKSKHNLKGQTYPFPLKMHVHGVYGPVLQSV